MTVVGLVLIVFFFFFKQKTAYEMRISDWSSDVCSSDLGSPLRREDQRPPGCLIRRNGDCEASGCEPSGTRPHAPALFPRPQAGADRSALRRAVCGHHFRTIFVFAIVLRKAIFPTPQVPSDRWNQPPFIDVSPRFADGFPPLLSANRPTPPSCLACGGGRSEEHTSELQSLMRHS